MSHKKDKHITVIPVDLIRETVMPPYEYQKPQYGFGSTGVSQSRDLNEDAKKRSSKVETKNKLRK